MIKIATKSLDLQINDGMVVLAGATATKAFTIISISKCSKQCYARKIERRIQILLSEALPIQKPF